MSRYRELRDRSNEVVFFGSFLVGFRLIKSSGCAKNLPKVVVFLSEFRHKFYTQKEDPGIHFFGKEKK